MSMSNHVNPENVNHVRRAISEGKISGTFYPAVYVIEPCSLCNLRCLICPNGKMRPENHGMMDFETLRRIMADISPYCEFLMLYWMGEPMLHPMLPEILRCAASTIRGKIVLSTNMTCLDERISKAILSHVDILLCSLDRWDKSAYEHVRRGAHFETVVSNIEAVLAKRRDESRCEVVVKAIDLDDDADEYSRFSAFWRERGARPLSAWLNDWAGSLPEVRSVHLSIPRRSAQRSPCADLWFKMIINWRGDVQMCCFDWNYSHRIGHAPNMGNWIADVWHSSEMLRLRRMQLQEEWASLDLCCGCTTWGEASELDAYVDFNEQSYFTVF